MMIKNATCYLTEDLLALIAPHRTIYNRIRYMSVTYLNRNNTELFEANLSNGEVAIRIARPDRFISNPLMQLSRLNVDSNTMELDFTNLQKLIGIVYTYLTRWPHWNSLSDKEKQAYNVTRLRYFLELSKEKVKELKVIKNEIRDRSRSAQLKELLRRQKRAKARLESAQHELVSLNSRIKKIQNIDIVSNSDSNSYSCVDGEVIFDGIEL